MNLKPFTGPGSTPSRRRFWDNVTKAVIASQKLAGRFVTIDEHPGKGTIVNVADTSARRTHGGVCDCRTPVFVQFSGITFDCGCTRWADSSVSFIVSDEGNMNSFSSTLNLGIHGSPPCGDCPDGDGNGRFWEAAAFNDTHLPHIFSDFYDDPDCTVPNTTHFEEVIFVILLCLGGTYHLFAINTVRNSLIFYGTSTDRTLPFANTVACTPDFTDFYGSNPAFQCALGSSGVVPDLTVCAHGGTGTVTV